MKRFLAMAVVLCAASAALGRTAPPRTPGLQWAHPAICRVIVAERGAVSYGSGTLVGVDQTLGLVITNCHVIRDAAGPIVVAFPDGFRSTATVLSADRDWDLAALAIRRPNVEPVALAGEAPRRGDPLTIAGYGSGWYKASTGRCTQYVSPGFGLPFEMVELDAAARQGDSGGPMLNQRGELAGVLFGTGFGRTAGSHSGRVRRFLDTVADDFQQLSTQSNMMAQRSPPTGDLAGSPGSAGGTVGQAGHQPKVGRAARPRNAPVAAITGGPHRQRSADGGRQLPARPELVELPVPRPYQPPVRSLPDVSGSDSSQLAQPGSGSATLENVPTSGGPVPEGPSRAEQAKTILAGVGILALLFHGLRMLGAAAQS